MMKNFTTTLIAIALLASTSFAQNIAICGSSLMEKYLKDQNPEAFERAQKSINKKVNNWIKANKFNKTQATITIPVVFHVLYTSPTMNNAVTAAKVNLVIDMLNEDFNAQNSDISQVPSNFQSVIGNVDLNFCLATFDPNGASTTGIIRNSTSKVFRPTSNIDDIIAPFYTSKGGNDLWDAGRYLNIYVINSGVASQNGTVLGWARKPGFSQYGFDANSDGVCVNWEVFAPGGSVSLYSKGRNTTHEVGHWLGLDHVFAEGAACADDNVSDTPLQGQATQASTTCPSTTRKSCGSVDMWMNFMDYAGDNCRWMFSAGQANRIRSFFNTDALRQKIPTSNGCGTGTAPVVDAELTRIVAPVNNSDVDCDTDLLARVQITNNGNVQLKSVDVKYKIDGVSEVTKSWTGTLNEGGQVLVNLAQFQVSTSGNHTFEAYLENPNGQLDDNPVNDKATNNFTSDCSVGINDLSGTYGFNIYPNPATDKIYIESNTSGIQDITLYNAFGEIVIRTQTDNGVSKLDLSDLTNGVYFIQLQSDNESSIKRINIIK